MEQNRIPFDISLRPEIEAGKYRVETRDGRPVEILKSDMPEPLPLLVLYDGNDVERVSKYGIYNLGHQGMNDLFLVPAEPVPGLTEFEQAVKDLIELVHDGNYLPHLDGLTLEWSQELLRLARKQIEAEQCPEPYDPRYDKKYLDAKIKKATESWKGVNVDKYLDEVRGGETLRWNKGPYYIPSGGAMCLIRTKKDTPDNGYLYFVEYRMDIAEYEEFISISELENLKTE